MTQTFKTRYGLSNALKVYRDPNATSATPQLAGYKGRNVFDSAAFYTPYVPLQMAGTILAKIGPVTVTIAAKATNNPWFPFEIYVGFDGNEPDAVKARNMVIDWCFDVWGEPGICEPALWCWNNGTIFAHKPEMEIEAKLRWHGLTLNEVEE
ncbi:MAG: hypothetical protein EOP84_01715 [Verrucomicrobiaceae bacterium]|nr:MAG: hypothetical protein EOP84_01715 [Verrucomicrobiaceae bacterium]